ncbi:hypothetical protein [Pyrococcus sp. ST04]|uniref:hypothetical protein n=1 Tax=Pyrococcus sp. ST04 TaxID=1183377 RepID=UPI00026059E0|nr:hypothetical protein [Pyrococcus sp. ST04]AFK21905.1 hypothetical protein Py04_0303 [Pyrococcus sp. ST04]
MRIMVSSRNYMNELSKLLSKAGIMNKTREELDWEIRHAISIKKKFSELKKIEIAEVKEKVREFEAVYSSIMKKLEKGNISFEDIVDDDIVAIEVLEALEKAGGIEVEDSGKIKLVKRVPLDDLVLEIILPLEDVIDKLEELEEVGGKIITEVAIVKKYYVEVMEVELEAIQKAIEIAEDYADEEVIFDATVGGVAKSALANVILDLVKNVRKKDELIEVLSALEPITLPGDKGEMRIYYDEDAIEDILKELQTLGYLKVKGNRIWFY